MGVDLFVMKIQEPCAQCSTKHLKKSGYIPTSQQNYRRKACGYQFSLAVNHSLGTDEVQTLIERLPRERLSLYGICRTVGIGSTWLRDPVVEFYEGTLEHLNVQPSGKSENTALQRLDVETDETKRIIVKEATQKWLWLTLAAQTRLVNAFQIGDCSRNRNIEKKHWKKNPFYRNQNTFRTDEYSVYEYLIPSTQYRVISKNARQINHVEFLNGTWQL